MDSYLYEHLTLAQGLAIVNDLAVINADPTLGAPRTLDVDDLDLFVSDRWLDWRYLDDRVLITGHRDADGTGWFSVAELVWVRNSPADVHQMISGAAQFG